LHLPRCIFLCAAAKKPRAHRATISSCPPDRNGSKPARAVSPNIPGQLFPAFEQDVFTRTPLSERMAGDITRRGLEVI
jgi:hypothetical protein